MATHQQGGRLAPAPLGRVVPGLALLPIPPLKPEGFRQAQRLQRQQRWGCRLVAPLASGQIQLQQALALGGATGEANQALPLSGEGCQVVERQRQPLPGILRRGQQRPLTQLPFPLATEQGQQQPITDRQGGHPKYPLGHGTFRRLGADGLPLPRLQRLATLQVPPTAAVGGHQQLTLGAPEGLKQRLGLSVPPGQAAGGQQFPCP